MQLKILLAGGPPSSPPMITLLPTKIMKHTTATIRNTNTENATAPAGTAYYLPSCVAAQ